MRALLNKISSGVLHAVLLLELAALAASMAARDATAKASAWASRPHSRPRGGRELLGFLKGTPPAIDLERSKMPKSLLSSKITSAAKTVA